MWFFTLALKNVFRHKARSSLTCTGIAIAIATMVTMVGIAEGFEQGITDIYRKRGIDLIVSRAGTVQRLAGQLDETLRQRLRGLSGIHGVEPLLFDVVSFEQSSIPAVCIFGWLPEESLMAHNLRVVAGRNMVTTDRRAVLLGRLLAHSLSKKVGDKLELEGAEFEVVGIFESGSVYENAGALVNLRELQELLGIPERVSYFLIRVEEGPRKKQTIDQLCEQIRALTGESGRSLALAAAPVQEQVRSHFEVTICRGMTWATSFIALLLGTVGVLNAMLISVSERTREIGTMRALGWSKARIVHLILTESLVLYAGAMPLGILLSVALNVVLNMAEATTILAAPVVAPAIVVEGCLLALLTGLIGSLYPALRAARLLPTEAIRHE